MDFSTFQCSGLFYAAWFILAYALRGYTKFDPWVNTLALALVILNAFKCREDGARQYTENRVVFIITSVMLGIAFISLQAFSNIPHPILMSTCFIMGIYSEHDSDAYYEEDVYTRWLYGLFLVLMVQSGVDMRTGLNYSIVIFMLGWVVGFAIEDRSLTGLLVSIIGIDYDWGLWSASENSWPFALIMLFGIARGIIG